LPLGHISNTLYMLSPPIWYPTRIARVSHAYATFFFIFNWKVGQYVSHTYQAVSDTDTPQNYRIHASWLLFLGSRCLSSDRMGSLKRTTKEMQWTSWWQAGPRLWLAKLTCPAWFLQDSCKRQPPQWHHELMWRWEGQHDLSSSAGQVRTITPARGLASGKKQPKRAAPRMARNDTSCGDAMVLRQRVRGSINGFHSTYRI
jgi:hypothetical protein